MVNSLTVSQPQASLVPMTAFDYKLNRLVTIAKDYKRVVVELTHKQMLVDMGLPLLLALELVS